MQRSNCCHLANSMLQQCLNAENFPFFLVVGERLALLNRWELPVWIHSEMTVMNSCLM